MTEHKGKNSKHHHYVPKGLQKHFCENGRNLWYSEKTDVSYSPPEWRNIDNTFKGKYYYTILDSNGKTTDAIEKNFYQVLDNHLASLLDEIKDIFEKGQIPIFEGTQLESIRNLVWELIKRGPDHFSDNDVELGQEVTEKTIERYADFDPTSKEIEKLRIRLADPKQLRQHGRSIRVLAKLEPSELVQTELQKFSVRWAVSRGRHSFLLSSGIVLRTGNGGNNGISNPNAELWFPISPKRAMVLLRDPEGRIPFENEVSQAKVREFNEFAARTSNQIASHSKELLESITGMKAKK